MSGGQAWWPEHPQVHRLQGSLHLSVICKCEGLLTLTVAQRRLGG